ncbi:MAG: aryl-sulfate sulfotransferase [Solirubrobacterales bacterium]|nr:aryl-sulfate sulfotransferase [Solirubrobacterales bacterium]
MTEPGRNTSEHKIKITPFAVAVVVGALLVGIGAGALVYREYRKNKNENHSKGSKKASGKDLAKLAPIVGSDEKSDPGDKYDAQFKTSSMWPAFNPKRHYYVTRCVPGRVTVQVRSNPDVKVKVWANPAASGRYAAEARPMPGQDFEIKITPDGGETQSYEVRCLPSDFPEWRYKRFRNPPKGMFMVTTYLKPGDVGRAWMMVFDQDGTPRWWYSTPTNTLGGQILPDGTVQMPRGFGDGFGQDARTATEIRSLDGKLQRLVKFKGAPSDGHEFVQLPNGNILINSYAPRYGVDLRPVGGNDDRGLLDGAFQEQTPDGKVVWSWNSKDHVTIEETPKRWWERAWRNPHYDEKGRIRYDQFHLNAIEPWRDEYVLSTRHTDSVWGISRKTGKVLWKFGGVQTPKSLKVLGDDPYKGYPLSGNHDVRMTGNVLSIHDNGVHIKGRAPRALRYRIDLKNRTATFISAFQDKDAAKSSQCCGSFRQMGDGYVVSWGANPWVDGFTKDGELAFRLGVPVPPYRAVPVPASVTEADLDAALDAMETEPKITNVPMTPLFFKDDTSNLQDKAIPGRKLGSSPDDTMAQLDAGKNVENTPPGN